MEGVRGISTSFHVYTPVPVIPSFECMLQQSNRYLKEVLRKNKIAAIYQIDVSIREQSTHRPVRFERSGPARWTEDQYAWFFVDGVGGGCDAYFDRIGELDVECWEDEIRNRDISRKMEVQIRECMNTGFYWWFRRSAGQPAIMNLSYGLIAAAFAKLTDGIIFSDDSAWDYEMFPTTADAFLQAYFDPEYPEREYADWARQNLDCLK